MEKTTIIVTDCHTRSGFVIACDLLRAGYQVVAMGLIFPTMCAGMKGVIAQEKYPEPFLDSDAFIEKLCLVAEKYKAAALLPCKDEAYIVSCYKNRFPDTLKILVSDFDYLIDIQNKQFLNQIFKGDIKVPKTIKVKTENDFNNAVATLGLPLVIKPVFGSGGEYCYIIHSENELAEVFSVVKDLKDEEIFIAQPFVKGQEVGFGGVVIENKVLGLCGQKVLRGVSAAGGLSTVRTTYRHEKIEAALIDVFSTIGFNGAFMVDLIIQNDDIYAIDLNPRYWGGVATAIDSGVHLAKLHVAAVLDNDFPNATIFPNKIIESHWALGNVRYFFSHLCKGRMSEAFKAFKSITGKPVCYVDFGYGKYFSFVLEFLSYLQILIRYGNLNSATKTKHQFFIKHRGKMKS